MILSRTVKYLLRYVALAYITVLVVVPVGLILWRTFAPGIGVFFASVTTPAAQSALQLSLLVVAIVVPLNVLFGVPTALVLARSRFRGKSVLQAIIDLPFAVSPVVVGVALILLWGSAGLLGFVENGLGFKIIFGLPGIVLASIFVTVPLRHPRGRAPALRSGHRSGGGRCDVGVAVVADVLADYPAVDPLGPDLRDRADHRADPWRVRRRHHGVVEPTRHVTDPDPAGLGPLQPLGRIRRLRRVDAADDRRRVRTGGAGNPRRPAGDRAAK